MSALRRAHVKRQGNVLIADRTLPTSFYGNC
jgi:hypothetical protein